MATFRYSSIEPSGRLITGVMDAPDEASVVERLRRQGHLPVQARPDRGRRIGDLLRAGIGPSGPRRGEVTELTRELATMLGAGQDLDRALRFVVETAPNTRVRTTMGQVREAVRGGAALSAALARFPGSFPPLYIGLVRAGEAGGQLGATLERLAVLLEKERSLLATIRAAMVYPAVLFVAAVGSILLLLTQVLPQFVPLFEQSGATLPRPTRLLIAAGDFVGQWGLPAVLVLAVAALAVGRLLRRPGPRLAVDRLRLSLPVLGPLSREALAARLSRTLGTLLVNGVPLIGALAVTRDVVGNAAGQRMLDQAAVAAKGGAGLSGALAAAAILPPRTVHLLRLGEETATLGPTALRAAEVHEEAVRLGLQRVVALLVPAITVLMGTAVAGIVSALLLAMLGLNDLAQ